MYPKDLVDTILLMYSWNM